MDLLSKTVWDALAESGVEKIYHANSVITSCQFIKQKALLARGAVDRLELPQTDQYSDDDDKRYSLWFDVFTDSVDIHSRASRRNKYGPILFVLDVEKLRKVSTGRVWVTKLNPTKWQGVDREDRWFQSKQDLEENFVYGNFDQMIVFRHCGGALPIEECIDEIIIDDPKQEIEEFDMCSAAYGALTSAMCDSGFSAAISRRVCASGCLCRAQYKREKQRTIEMFFPSN